VWGFPNTMTGMFVSTGEGSERKGGRRSEANFTPAGERRNCHLLRGLPCPASARPPGLEEGEIGPRCDPDFFPVATIPPESWGRMPTAGYLAA
jgi:hypothetical protein